VTQHTIVAEIKRYFQLAGMPDDEREVAYPTVEIAFTYKRGSPAVMYQRNGDPGWPAEPAEIELVSAKLVNGDGLMPTPDQLNDWAQDWLDSDSGYSLAVDAAS
jgi:hypothetical protein